MNQTSIFTFTLALILILSPALSTTLTYITEQEIDQADAFVELTAKVQVDGPSLHVSINTAQQLIDNIKEIVTKDC